MIFAWDWLQMHWRLCNDFITCKKNRRIWRPNASNSRSRDVTDQLWWRHNTKSEKTVLNDNGEMGDSWLILVEWGYNAARPPGAQTITQGRLLFHHTIACKNGIKTFRRTHLFRHYNVHNFHHSLNGNTNFKIRFVFGMCDARHLAIGAWNK